MKLTTWYSSIEMTPVERADFLADYTTALFSTLRKDGAPFGVPLGYLLDADVFDESTPIYLSLGGRQSMVRRIQGDPRICMTVENRQFPTSAVIAEGNARVIADHDHEISLRLIRKGFPKTNTLGSDELDYTSFEQNWLSVGRAVLRIDFYNIISWDSRKNPGFAQVPSVHRAHFDDR